MTEVELPSNSQRATTPSFLGRWRIVETEVWEQDALDMVTRAHITFIEEQLGHFQMIAVDGGIDCRFHGSRVEFSWIGDDDGDRTRGRGWAEIQHDGTMRGRVYFHQGDDSAFTAKRDDHGASRKKAARHTRGRRA